MEGATVSSVQDAVVSVGLGVTSTCPTRFHCSPEGQFFHPDFWRTASECRIRRAFTHCERISSPKPSALHFARCEAVFVGVIHIQLCFVVSVGMEQPILLIG